MVMYCAVGAIRLVMADEGDAQSDDDGGRWGCAIRWVMADDVDAQSDG